MRNAEPKLLGELLEMPVVVAALPARLLPPSCVGERVCRLVEQCREYGCPAAHQALAADEHLA
jgi:hypothetical protein